MLQQLHLPVNRHHAEGLTFEQGFEPEQEDGGEVGGCVPFV